MRWLHSSHDDHLFLLFPDRLQAHAMTVQHPLPPPAGLLMRMRRLWPYFGRPLWVWGVAVVATLLLALSEPLIPALLQPLLDRGFQKGALPLWAVPVSLVAAGPAGNINAACVTSATDGPQCPCYAYACKYWLRSSAPHLTQIE